MCFRLHFLRKMWPIQLAFLLFIVCRIFLSSFTICSASSFLAWSVQLMFSILLHYYISKLPTYLPQCLSFSTIKRKLCSKFSTLIVSSLNLGPICWWRYRCSCWMLLLPWQYLHIKTHNQPRISAMLSHPQAVYGYLNISPYLSNRWHSCDGASNYCINVRISDRCDLVNCWLHRQIDVVWWQCILLLP